MREYPETDLVVTQHSLQVGDVYGPAWIACRYKNSMFGQIMKQSRPLAT